MFLFYYYLRQKLALAHPVLFPSYKQIHKPAQSIGYGCSVLSYTFSVSFTLLLFYTLEPLGLN